MTPIRDEFDLWLEDQAPLLRRHWDSPELWPRIAGSLEIERARRRPASSRGLGWLAAIAAAALMVLVPSAWWIWRARVQPPALLTEQALGEVRTAEQAYALSIEKLARAAGPRIENPPTALIATYREKLFLLDSAIANLKAEAERNPYNFNIRRELLALYQDKQQTLKEILDETPASPLAQ